MKIVNKHLRNNQWLSAPILAGAYQPWLIDNGSLTTALQNKFQTFSVKPVTLDDLKPLPDEAHLLSAKPNKAALIREVLLIGNGQAVVFAHSVLPRASLRGAWSALGKLGNKPLGAALFADPRVKRTPLTYKKLSNTHLLYRRATKHLDSKPPCLWARRSVFSLGCANILVTEIFLPQLIT